MRDVVATDMDKMGAVLAYEAGGKVATKPSIQHRVVQGWAEVCYREPRMGGTSQSLGK